MNYELAKQIKDAGFPKDYSDWEDHDEELLQKGWGMYSVGYSPTLSELIEACGEEFMLTNEMGYWDAWSNQRAERTYPARMGEVGAKYECRGKTPEEAVANLWLELNKK